MRVFISGGCKNGKSRYAQKLARQMCSNDFPLYYLATMIPTDKEDWQRIEKHRREREGWGFETIEISRDLFASTDGYDAGGSFLLDSVTALLANEMFEKNGNVLPNAVSKVAEDLMRFVKKVENIVLVSDDIYSEACLYNAVTEEYRKGLATIGRKLVSVCDSVLEVTAGNIVVHQ